MPTSCPVAAIPFLLDLLKLPLDLFPLFLVAGIWCARVGDVVEGLSQRVGSLIADGNTALYGAVCQSTAMATAMKAEDEEAGDSRLYGVVLLSDGARRKVETGITDLQYSEVLSGLSAGDRVLMLPSSGLIRSQRRFQDRMQDPKKRWKLSDMDLESRLKWEDYSKAKDDMFAYTDIKQAPWYVVPANRK